MTLKGWRIPIGVLALLAALFLQTTLSMRQKSGTSDELAHHIASGYSHLVKRDFRMNPAQPPLPRILSAIPLVIIGAKGPFHHPSWEEGNSPAFAKEFLYRANHEADRFTFWARMPVLLISLMFAGFVFFWARKLFGIKAAFISLILYVFCPDIIAHSGLATSDLCVSFFFFLTCGFFWFYLKEPGRQTLVLTGVAAGCAFLSKFTALLLLPILLLVLICAGEVKRVGFKPILIFAAVMLGTIWLGYFFEFKPLLEHTPDPAKKIAFLRDWGGENLVRFARDTRIPLASFFSALGSMLFTRAAGTRAFLLGEWSTAGWWYYYFVAFFVKNTVPFLILIALSALTFKRLKLDRLAKASLLVPIVFFFVVTLPDKAQAGIRYFLPIYPFFFILCGGAGAYLIERKRVWIQVLVAVLLVWHAVSALRVYPDYLAYFNEAVGGPRRGYRILRDSNIDWGQDLKGLGEYAARHGLDEVVLFYYGSADPAYYKIPYRLITDPEFLEPQKTLYALGVHNIDSVKWFEAYEPTGIIGYSIYVYDFRDWRKFPR